MSLFFLFGHFVVFSAMNWKIAIVRMSCNCYSQLSIVMVNCAGIVWISYDIAISLLACVSNQYLFYF